MKLGCNTVLFGAVDLATALEYIAWAGYRFVELAAIAGMCEHVEPDVDTATVRRALRDRDLTATALEAATTDRTRLERLLRLASDLGVPIVNIGSGGVSGDEQSTAAAIEHVGGLARLAGSYGVRLAVKPHVGQAVYDAATALRLMAEVREPALGLNFDPSHLFRAGEEPPEAARRWGHHIMTCHMRDCASRDLRVGAPETQIPGRGAVDIAATLRALDEIGFAGPLNVEIIGAVGYDLPRAMGLAAESRGYLHRCLLELAATR